MARAPADVEAWRTLAGLREAAGQLEGAAAAYAQVLARAPESREALLAAGRLALRRGQEGEGLGHLERVLSLSDEPEPLLRVAFTLIEARSPRAAARVLDRARAAGERDARVAYYAGLVHEHLGAPAQAAAAFADVAPGAEQFHEARLHRAACLTRLGDHPRALALLRAALEERPEDPAVQQAHARALERAGERAAAEAALRAALARRPLGPLHIALAQMLARGGAPQEAQRVLEGALAHKPHDAALLQALATVQAGAGQGREATRTLERLLQHHPRHAPAMSQLGFLLAQRGEALEAAERWVQGALAQEPDSGLYLDSLGWVYLRRGEAERAVEVLGRAARLAPQEPRVHEHLGDALNAVGRLVEAASAYRRALQALTALAPEAGEPLAQQAALERKLKMLSSRASDD